MIFKDLRENKIMYYDDDGDGFYDPWCDDEPRGLYVNVKNNLKNRKVKQNNRKQKPYVDIQLNDGDVKMYDPWCDDEPPVKKQIDSEEINSEF